MWARIARCALDAPSLRRLSLRPSGLPCSRVSKAGRDKEVQNERVKAGLEAREHFGGAIATSQQPAGELPSLAFCCWKNDVALRFAEQVLRRIVDDEKLVRPITSSSFGQSCLGERGMHILLWNRCRTPSWSFFPWFRARARAQTLQSFQSCVLTTVIPAGCEREPPSRSAACQWSLWTKPRAPDL